MKISLDDLAHAMERSDVVTAYVDVQEGRIVILEDADEGAVFEHAMRMEEDFERYIPLTNLYDGEEPVAMQAFADAQPLEIQKRLHAILAAPGATPKFHRAVRRLLLGETWKRFLHEHFRKVAQDFCEENGIEYGAEHENGDSKTEA